MFSKFLFNLYNETDKLNDKNMEAAVAEIGKVESILDIGCWVGDKTKVYGKICNAKKIMGIEPVAEGAKRARKRGIDVMEVSVDREKIPLKSGSVDLIVNNQVIEHLSDLDFFYKEVHRVLKKGGYFITSTNNLSGWHNIISLLFGWTPFDLTNASYKQPGLGNPLALHRQLATKLKKTFTHKCIYTIKWLTEWAGIYGFKTIKSYGAGYYPLPAWVGKIDKKHSAFFVLIQQKE